MQVVDGMNDFAVTGEYARLRNVSERSLLRITDEASVESEDGSCG